MGSKSTYTIDNTPIPTVNMRDVLVDLTMGFVFIVIGLTSMFSSALIVSVVFG